MADPTDTPDIPLSIPTFFGANVWADQPTFQGIFVYSILTPAICLCGLVGNLICLIVLTKKQFVCSFYVYLKVIAVVDLASCGVVFMSGLARGILWHRYGWAAYDALISIPLGGLLSNMSTISTLFITIDRLVYLKNPLRRFKPKFCCRKTAMLVTAIGFVVSLISTVPYCFIFEITDGGTLNTTVFYHSSFYMYYTWYDFTLFAIIPATLLLICNSLLILTIKNANKMQLQMKMVTGKAQKLRDQSKITATLVAIVFCYLLGEFPTHLFSRKTSANILFGGDNDSADASFTLELWRQITTVLNALHLTLKFLLYCHFCPPFHKALKAALVGKPRNRDVEVAAVKEARNLSLATIVPVRVFFIQDVQRKPFRVDQLGFMNVFINTKSAQEFPRFI